MYRYKVVENAEIINKKTNLDIIIIISVNENIKSANNVEEVRMT